jgi:hypothetical protein
LRNVAWTLIFPAVLFVLEIISGVFLIVKLASGRGSTLFQSVGYGISYFSLSAATNVSITLAIALPLLLRRRKMMREFGSGYNRPTKPYIAISTILIESSALVAFVTSLWIGFYAARSPVAHMLVSVAVQVQVSDVAISPNFQLHK